MRGLLSITRFTPRLKWSVENIPESIAGTSPHQQVITKNSKCSIANKTRKAIAGDHLLRTSGTLYVVSGDVVYLKLLHVKISNQLSLENKTVIQMHWQPLQQHCIWV